MIVKFDALPKNIDAFRAMPGADLTKPENTCALFLCALNLYPDDPEQGIAAVDDLRGPRPLLEYDKQFLRDRLRGKPYLPLAYFNGARPENGYTPDVPYVLEVLEDPRPQDVEEGYLRVYLKTAGADSPRPVRLRRKGQKWYLWEYSSILSGIRIPVSEDPWA